MSLFFVEIAFATVVTSCIVCTVIEVVFFKWRLKTFYDTRIKGKRIFSHRIGELCLFCTGFWLSALFITVVYFWVHLHEFYFITPFASASITRRMLENLRIKEG